LAARRAAPASCARRRSIPRDLGNSSARRADRLASMRRRVPPSHEAVRESQALRLCTSDGRSLVDDNSRDRLAGASAHASCLASVDEEALVASDPLNEVNEAYSAPREGRVAREDEIVRVARIPGGYASSRALGSSTASCPSRSPGPGTCARAGVRGPRQARRRAGGPAHEIAMPDAAAPWSTSAERHHASALKKAAARASARAVGGAIDQRAGTQPDEPRRACPVLRRMQEGRACDVATDRMNTSGVAPDKLGVTRG
jgi:hypothetical protein